MVRIILAAACAVGAVAARADVANAQIPVVGQPTAADCQGGGRFPDGWRPAGRGLAVRQQPCLWYRRSEGDRDGHAKRAGPRGVHAGHDQALPMAADFRARIAAAMDRISDDPTESGIMRDLAVCARLTLLEEVPLAVPPGAIALEYVCGTTFRVRNSAARAATLRYEVEGTPESGDVVVEAHDAADFITEKPGTVRLLQNGALLATAANGGATCP